MSHRISRSALAAILALGFAPVASSAWASTPASSPAPWYENLSLFVGLDGSKQPQDLGINANMGGRFAADLGMPLLRSHGLGLHVGAAANVSDAAVHVLDQIEGTSRRTQLYSTVGLFQRTESRLTWALGYDFQAEHYYDDFQLSQLRGSAGYGVTPSNELGVWFATSLAGDDGVMGGVPVRLDPITQTNAYLAHTWPSNSRTTVWAGMARGHDNVVWVLPHNSRNENVFVYGAELHMPLSDRFAVTGAANFLTPTSTGTVDAFLGLAWYPGRNVMSKDSDSFAPVMTAGNNPTFSVDLRR